MYSILYLVEAVYVRDAFGKRAISTFATKEEANKEIDEIFNTLSYTPSIGHPVKRFHFEVVEAPDV